MKYSAVQLLFMLDKLMPAHWVLRAGTLPSEWATMRKLQGLYLGLNMINGVPHAVVCRLDLYSDVVFSIIFSMPGYCACGQSTCVMPQEAADELIESPEYVGISAASRIMVFVCQH